MKKLIFALSVGLIAIVVLAVVFFYQPAQQPQPQTFSYNFEDGFEGWVTDADLPEDPNRPGELVDWRIELAGNVSSSGSKSVLLYIDGTQDDGTLWIERKLHLEPNTQKTVNLSFQFWSESESFNTLGVVVGYAGSQNPEVEDDFVILGSANEAEGWKAYNLTQQIQTDASGDVHVALGFSVRWEAHLTYFVDDVKITIT
jgi:hypothetical protein